MEQLPKESAMKSVSASLVIGIIGSIIGGFFSNCLQLVTDAQVPYNNFNWAIPGAISGFLLCFLSSLIYLWSIKGIKNISSYRGRGIFFGAVAGALSGFVSLFFIDQIVSPGWLTGVQIGCGKSLLGSALAGIPSGAIIGVIAAFPITIFMLQRSSRKNGKSSCKQN